ncbi:hypothetical protein NIA69_14235 [Gemmiger formicilis]|nr:hypothetical protein [Gemmiger formicilis]
MQYLSTRDSALRVSAQEAIVRGLAPQSGLFVPETFPRPIWTHGKISPIPSWPRRSWPVF